MKVEFLRKFYKDLDGVKTKSVRESVIRIIELMETVDTLEKIPNIKKLKGHRNAYRVRVGDYRLGFFFENATVLLARFLHRKDIYRIFP